MVTLGMASSAGTTTGRRSSIAIPTVSPAAGNFLAVGAGRIGAAFFLAFSAKSPAQTELIVPLLQDRGLSAGVGFITLTYFVIVGTSNAVNLTDGLDGLAIMPTVWSLPPSCSLPTSPGTRVYAKYLFIPYVPGRANCASSRAPWQERAWLPVVQRLSGRGSWATSAPRPGPPRHRGGHRPPGNRAPHHGRRLRRRNPVGDAAGRLLQIHQEEIRRRAGASCAWRPCITTFEQTGWKETQVVVRFWIITIMLVLVGLSPP